MPLKLYVVVSPTHPSSALVYPDLESALFLARRFGRMVYQYDLNNSVKIEITNERK